MSMRLRLFLLLKSVAGAISLKTILGLCLTATYVVQAWAVAESLKLVFLGQQLDRLWWMMLLIGGMIVLRAGLVWLNEVLGKKIACVVKERLRKRLFAHFLSLGPGYQEKCRSGNIQSVLTDGVEAVEPFLVGYIPQLLVTFVGSAILTAYIWRLDAMVGVVTLAGIILAVVVPQVGSIFISKHILEYWSAYGALNAQYIDAMQGMTTLKIFNAGKKKEQELERQGEDFYHKSMNSLSVSLSDSALVSWVSAAGTVFASGVGALRVAGGYLPGTELFIILFLSVECFRPLQDLNRYWHQSYLGISAAKSIFAVLDEPPSVTAPEAAEKSEEKRIPPRIQLQDVTFAYSQGKRPALERVSLTIEPGETVAVVGKSGSGKSTLVNLLLRFYDPQQGAILYDGVNIRDYPLWDLRRQISVVFQETNLFYGSVADNLRIAKPAASQAELEAAAKRAHAHEFILGLKEVYDTHVGERGIRLSGGQRQRIALARAFLKDAPVLILDEATSNVDGESEKKIQDALEFLVRGRTTLIIAHRLSTIQGADRIFVLDDYRLVESGSHERLVANRGIYWRLIEAQQMGGA
jgi:ATP-binding cassette subfamily C protein CydD